MDFFLDKRNISSLQSAYLLVTFQNLHFFIVLLFIRETIISEEYRRLPYYSKTIHVRCVDGTRPILLVFS